MNEWNQILADSQIGQGIHSSLEGPLVHYADDAVNIMKTAKRYSTTDTQNTQNHDNKRLKKRWLYTPIAFLAVIIAIALILIVLLLIRSKTVDPPESVTNEIIDVKGDDLINFITDGLNSNISPCHDFYGHVCSNHSSSSLNLLEHQFYRLIMRAINNDAKHPKVAETLQHFVEECAKVNGSNILQHHLIQQNMDSLNLPPFRSKTLDKNFNFMAPLVRILFHSPTINTRLLHRIFFDNNTITFYGDPKNSFVTYRFSPYIPNYVELTYFENFYNYYLTVLNVTKNDEELTDLQSFVMKFQRICADSVIYGSVTNVEIKSSHNVHFKEALEQMLPFLFHQNFNAVTNSKNFRISVDQEMIDNFQQLFMSNPSEGQLFLRIVAYSAFNEPTPAGAMNSMDSLRQICFYRILSEERFAIFNLYAVNLMLRSEFPMTQVHDQLLVIDMIKKIQQTIRAKLLATAWLQTDRDAAKIIQRLMDTKLIIGLPESVAKNGDVSEIDRFEVFLSLHRDRKDSQLLVHLANARLKNISEFELHFITNALTSTFPNYTTIEILLMFLQRPFYAAEFPESYNYGFMGSTIGHELYHQLTPEGITMSWWNNARYSENVACYTEFYDGICFNLTLNSYFTNATSVREVCAEGLTDRDENIPDVEGTRVAFETMKEVLSEEKLKERAMPEFDYTNEQMFFVATAQLHCNKKLNDHEYLANNINNYEPHASGNVRVNAVAMQMAEFAEAFQCQPGNPMVAAEKEKCYLLPPV